MATLPVLLPPYRTRSPLCQTIQPSTSRHGVTGMLTTMRDVSRIMQSRYCSINYPAVADVSFEGTRAEHPADLVWLIPNPRLQVSAPSSPTPQRIHQRSYREAATGRKHPQANKTALLQHHHPCSSSHQYGSYENVTVEPSQIKTRKYAAPLS